MSKKIAQTCLWCGRVFEAYPSNHRKFCCSECHYKHATKMLNPDGYTHHPHLSELNRSMNPYKMTPAIKEKMRNARLGTGTGRSYEKTYGRHTHRVVAEQILGRPLLPNEVVHHIDGNVRNNAPENLVIFPSQREHAKTHALSRGDHYAKCE